jgi:hypothetical protein
MRLGIITYLVISFLIFSMYTYAQSINNQPIADVGINRSVKLIEKTRLFGFGSDKDNDPIAFKWQLIDKPGGSQSVLSGSETANPTFIPDIEGFYVFTLRTNDGKSFSVPKSVKIIASPIMGNTKPVSKPGNDRKISVNQKTTLSGFGFDADGDILSYMWMLLKVPIGSKTMLDNAYIQSPVLTPDIIGNYSFVLVVNDGKEDSKAEQVSLEASSLGSNRAPSSDAGYDKTINLGQKAMLLGHATDPDNEPLNYLWTVVSKPAGSQTSLSNIDASNPTFTTDVAGAYIFSLSVDDGKIDSQASLVTYNAQITPEGNKKPIADAGVDRNVNLGEEIELQGIGLDPDNPIISYRWAVINKPVTSGAFLSNPNSQNPSFSVNLVGKYTFGLIVNDGKEDSLFDEVIITASDGSKNRAPSSDAGYDKTINLGQKAMLLGHATDPDNDPLTYAWSMISKPVESQAALSGVDTLIPSFTPDVAGDYKINLKVNDGNSNFKSNTVTYTAQIPIQDNKKPISNAGSSKDVKVGDRIRLNGIGTDADGDILVYRWVLTSKPENSRSYLSNPNFKISGFTADVVGTYTFGLIVNDGKEDSSLSVTTLNVGEAAQLCIQGTCDIVKKQWCNDGVFTSSGYCEFCGNQDSSCNSCTGNSCDAANQKWCQNGAWTEGTYSQYCSRCGYADSSCPICNRGICDSNNQVWCTNTTVWSTKDYCGNCGGVDSTCKDNCQEGACDIENNKLCKGGKWQDQNYCINCGKIDSSCASTCSNNACDIDSKQWCNNGVWSSVNYCVKCGVRDLSCGTGCANGICDVKTNRWCNLGSWDSLNYCDHCSDSECLSTCPNNACDIASKQWCDMGIWNPVDYCLKCGTKDSSCSVSCQENACDANSNKRCSNGVWVSTNYCDHCGLQDSDCTLICAEGKCDRANKVVCIGGKWNSSSYGGMCDTRQANATPNINVSSCLDSNNCTLGDFCISSRNCISGFCLNNECSKPGCSDNIKNNNETDVDCGGSCSNKCESNQNCDVDNDCASGLECIFDTCLEIIDDDDVIIDELDDVIVQDNEDLDELQEEIDIDKDKDGLLDEWELEYGLNPDDPLDSGLDLDEDGLLNIQEFTYGTNPKKPDTDNDGFSDKEEIDKGTDPLDSVSKPGGIGGMLFFVVILIILFGGGSYAVYFYKDRFFGPKSFESKPILPYKPQYSTLPRRPSPNILISKANIEETVKKRRLIKEEKRNRLLQKFGNKTDNIEKETKPLVSLKPVESPTTKKSDKEVFSELKLISNKK